MLCLVDSKALWGTEHLPARYRAFGIKRPKRNYRSIFGQAERCTERKGHCSDKDSKEAEDETSDCKR